MDRLRRALLAAAIAAGAVVAGATPAYAHGAGGVQPTNYRTTVESVSPAVPGLRVRAVDFGELLEVTYTGTETLTVLGYDGEPYLRVGPGGVFRNERSPATFLNRSMTPSSAPPARFDAKAPPEWKRISTGRTARWHDHRAHWMSSEPPDSVKADPWYCHVVIDGWKVALVHGDRPVTVSGDVTVWLVRRPPRDATPLALVAGLAMFLAGGIGDIATLGRALVPSTLPATANRIFVALALGLGAGVAVTAARHLRPEPRGAAPAAGDGPPGSDTTGLPDADGAPAPPRG